MIQKMNVKERFKAREDSQKRKSEILQVLSLKSGEACVFNTDNIRSWKASFYSYLKEHDIKKKYTFRRQSGSKDLYMVGLIEG